MLMKEQANFQKNCSPELGDSFEPQLWLGDWFELYTNIQANSVDLLLTDPPYGILRERQKWDKPIDLPVLERTFDHVLCETGLAILFCDLRLLRRILDTFTLFVLRSFHIWKKPSAMPISELLPLPNIEFILVLKRKGTKTSQTVWHPRDMIPPAKPYLKKSNILESPTRRMRKGEVIENDNGKRWVPVSLDAPNKPTMPESERCEHPTQKPESLLRMLIRGYSDPGDLIVDSFFGCGSTLISAYKENRPSIGVELSFDYYEMAKERISRATSQQNLFHSECMA